QIAEPAQACRAQSVELVRPAAEGEKRWAEYLVKDGCMSGLQYNIPSQYVEYITNLRMRGVGLEPICPGASQNPIPWINAWLVSDDVQVARQEVEVSSYLVGQIDAGVSVEDLGDFEL